MSPVVKLMGGFLLGAALGSGIYVLLTQDNDVGIIGNAKTFMNKVVAEGKQAADIRRTELQIELGQKPKY